MLWSTRSYSPLLTIFWYLLSILYSIFLARPPASDDLAFLLFTFMKSAFNLKLPHMRKCSNWCSVSGLFHLTQRPLIHVVTSDRILFFHGWIILQCMYLQIYVYIYLYSFSVHLMNRCLGYFHFWAIVNRAAKLKMLGAAPYSTREEKLGCKSCHRWWSITMLTLW